jgi:hypothetical protein
MVAFVLGLKFRVMVLVPMNAIILATVAALNVSRGNALSAAVIEAVIAIIACELGYVWGAAARLLLLRGLADLRGRCPGAEHDGRHGANQN